MEDVNDTQQAVDGGLSLRLMGQSRTHMDYAFVA